MVVVGSRSAVDRGTPLIPRYLLLRGLLLLLPLLPLLPLRLLQLLLPLPLSGAPWILMVGGAYVDEIHEVSTFPEEDSACRSQV